MARRFKIRSDVMSCGVLSWTASLSEKAGNATTSAVTLSHTGARSPPGHNPRGVNMLRVKQERMPSHYSTGFLVLTEGH